MQRIYCTLSSVKKLHLRLDDPLKKSLRALKRRSRSSANTLPLRHPPAGYAFLVPSWTGSSCSAQSGFEHLLGLLGGRRLRLQRTAMQRGGRWGCDAGAVIRKPVRTERRVELAEFVRTPLEAAAEEEPLQRRSFAPGTRLGTWLRNRSCPGSHREGGCSAAPRPSRLIWTARTWAVIFAHGTHRAARTSAPKVSSSARRGGACKRSWLPAGNESLLMTMMKVLLRVAERAAEAPQHRLRAAVRSISVSRACLCTDAQKGKNDVGNSHSNPIARGDTCTFRQCGAACCRARPRQRRARGLKRLKLDASRYVTWFCWRGSPWAGVTSTSPRLGGAAPCLRPRRFSSARRDRSESQSMKVQKHHLVCLCTNEVLTCLFKAEGIGDMWQHVGLNTQSTFNLPDVILHAHLNLSV